VQIVMYRVQAQATALDRVTERLELARSGCKQAHEHRKMVTSQIEQGEARKRNSQNPSDQRAAEEMLSGLKSSIQMWDGNEQQCEIEQADLETQFRTEQTKMNDLQDQLDKLDRLLASTSK
jgi:predicted  nucleic acid-binding Zn-ribbon protein